jgi:hypothetical protein
MVAIMKKAKNNFKSGCWSGGDLTIRSKWTSLQNKYRLEDAQKSQWFHYRKR